MRSVAADAGALPRSAVAQLPSAAVDIAGVSADIAIREARVGLGDALFEFAALKQIQIGRLEFLGHGMLRFSLIS